MAGSRRRARLLNLPRFSGANGRLIAVEAGKGLPFPVRRVFFFDKVPRGGTRGGHAHRRQEQLIVCLAGSFNIRLDDGKRTRTVRLDDPGRGLYLPPLVWSSLEDFRGGAVGLVLASAPFNESDYIRDPGAFRAATRATRRP